MAIAIGNVTKFLEDHTEISEREAEKILNLAQGLAVHGIINGGSIPEVFGRLTSQFQEETKSQEHREIGLKALQETP